MLNNETSTVFDYTNNFLRTYEMPASVECIDQIEDNLEGDFDVKLAPVSGNDQRRQLPRELFVRKPAIFVTKYLFAMALITACWAAIWLNFSWPVVVSAMVVNGLMYAHLIELQHECLHGHAFLSPKLNRLFGTLCGIFVMGSHSHYRYDHLRHHAYLGTSQNKEHFSYRFQNLNSSLGFAMAFFDLSRYIRVARFTMLAILWQPLPGIEKENYSRSIKLEHLLYFILLIASVVLTVYTRSSIFVLAWWLPALLISEGVHFMIEMPEHFGLNTQTNANVLDNTRTINTSKLVSWFVNGNDIHTAHHYHQGVPMCNLRKLHDLIEPNISVIEPSYLHFYGQVVQGQVNQDMDETCMAH
jgi:fatty acid desaturase